MTGAGETGWRRTRLSPLLGLLRLSASDQRHEPLLTSCLVIAIASVMVPLLLLYSVKVGFVERMRADLIRDPTFREIQAAEADIKPPQLLASIAKLAGNGFFVPSVMLTPRDVPVESKPGGRKKIVQARLVPTADGDPVLERISGTWTSADKDAVVLSAELAAELGVNPGDTVTLNVARTENRKTRLEKLPAKVTGVLPPEATSLPALFAAQQVDQDIEDYRAGIAVPARGWPPVKAPPRQAYEQLLVGAPQALDEVEIRDMLLTVGGVSFKLLASPETGTAPLFELIGLPPNAATTPAFAIRSELSHFYVLSNSTGGPQPSRFYGASDIEEAQSLAERFAGRVFGHNRPLRVSIGPEMWTAIAPDPRLFIGLRETSYPWRFGTLASFDSNLRAYAAAKDADKLNGSPVRLILDSAFSSEARDAVERISFNLEIAPGSFVQANHLIVSPALVAMLMRSTQVPLGYDAAERSVHERSAGLRGFRIVARELTDVPRIAGDLASIGVSVRAKSDSIIKLQRLDRSLDFLVLALGTVSLAGGMLVMAATCVSNVKRKAVQFATLRLIGLSKTQVFWVPMIQSVLAAMLAAAISLVLFFTFSHVINTYIAQLVRFEGRLSLLEAHHLAAAFLLVTGGAALASLLAARKRRRSTRHWRCGGTHEQKLSNSSARHRLARRRSGLCSHDADGRNS